MNWSLAFEPLISWQLLAIIAVPVLALAVAGLFLRQREPVDRFLAEKAVNACAGVKFQQGFYLARVG